MFILGKMVANTAANTKMTRSMDLEFTRGLTVAPTLAIGGGENSTVSVRMPFRGPPQNLVSGRKANALSGSKRRRLVRLKMALSTTKATLSRWKVDLMWTLLRPSMCPIDSMSAYRPLLTSLEVCWRCKLDNRQIMLRQETNSTNKLENVREKKANK